MELGSEQRNQGLRILKKQTCPPPVQVLVLMRAVTHPCFLSFQFGLVPSLLSKAGFLPDIPMATVFPNSTYAATTLPALPSDKRDKNIYFIIFLVSIQRNGFHFNLFVPYKSLYSGIFVCCCFSLLFFFLRQNLSLSSSQPQTQTSSVLGLQAQVIICGQYFLLS